jgi:2-polyprenyl-3-methyl-5-hydroxy-6-metoxy-1,4-benzoquinol methylase
LHNTAGRANSTWGNDYWWVIPNGFDLEEWQRVDPARQYVLFMGRLCHDKGLDVFAAMAKARPDLQFLMVGQGDPAPWLALGLPNLEYRPPVTGTARAGLYEGAIATVAMSRYLEPFGQVHAESMLMGTPVIVSDYGAYPEYVDDGRDGYRCRTLGDCLAALERLEGFGPIHADDVAARARGKFDMTVVAHQYDRVFRQLSDLWGEGWMRRRSVFGPITKATKQPTPWEQAQSWEKEWWLADTNGRWSREGQKQLVYASLMGMPSDLNFQGKHLLDLGCGPVSLLHRARFASAIAVDPIDFGDEEAYAHRRIARIYGRAEDYAVDEMFDEVWLYNVLQHVENPTQVLTVAKNALRPTGALRIFEWINTPPCPGHLHELRLPLFEEALPASEWVREQWGTGRLTGPLFEMVPGDYFVGVIRKPTR